MIIFQTGIVLGWGYPHGSCADKNPYLHSPHAYQAIMILIHTTGTRFAISAATFSLFDNATRMQPLRGWFHLQLTCDHWDHGNHFSPYLECTYDCRSISYRFCSLSAIDQQLFTADLYGNRLATWDWWLVASQWTFSDLVQLNEDWLVTSCRSMTNQNIMSLMALTTAVPTVYYTKCSWILESLGF